MLFHSGTIHAVLNDKKSDIILVKNYLEVYERDYRKKDISGFTKSDGSFKKFAREFENNNMRKRLNLSLPNGHILPPLNHNITLHNLNHLNDYDIDAIYEDLDTNGVTVVSGIMPESNMFKRSCRYFEKIMKLPQNIDLSNINHAKALHDSKLAKKYGLTNNHLKRNHHGMNQHIPRKNCITGYGAYCKEAIKEAAMISPLLKDIYQKIGWDTPICTGIDLSSQVS